MTRDEIFDKVAEILEDALGVDQDQIAPDATIMGDLGAESIDILDIRFKLEQEFGFTVAQGEMFPENVLQDPEFVQDGKLTDKGIEGLKTKLPHFDFSALDEDRSVEQVRKVFTVGALVNFCDNKLQQA